MMEAISDGKDYNVAPGRRTYDIFAAHWPALAGTGRSPERSRLIVQGSSIRTTSLPNSFEALDSFVSRTPYENTAGQAPCADGRCPVRPAR